MKVCKIFIMSMAVIVFLGFLAGDMAWATPSAELTYTETALGGDLWQYEYTIFNTSDPDDDLGFDLYDIFFTFDFEAAITVAHLPDNWDGWGETGFAVAFSLLPGTPSFGGADIGPGESLGGFIFQFDRRVGDLSFEATIFNPDPENPFNPVISAGTAINVTPIPEPSTIFLFLMGLIGLMGVKKMIQL